MIQVIAETGGKVTDIELDPRVMRLSTVDLATELVVAVNAALADLQSRIKDALVGPDLDSLANQLKEVQEQSTRQMGTFLQALTDAQERIANRAGADMAGGIQISPEVLRLAGPRCSRSATSSRSSSTRSSRSCSRSASPGATTTSVS